MVKPGFWCGCLWCYVVGFGWSGFQADGFWFGKENVVKANDTDGMGSHLASLGPATRLSECFHWASPGRGSCLEALLGICGDDLLFFHFFPCFFASFYHSRKGAWLVPEAFSTSSILGLRRFTWNQKVASKVTLGSQGAPRLFSELARQDQLLLIAGPRTIAPAPQWEFPKHNRNTTGSWGTQLLEGLACCRCLVP